MPQVARCPTLPRNEQGSGSPAAGEVLSSQSSERDAGATRGPTSKKGDDAMDHGFIEALRASGPHPSLGAHADTYAPIIGSWSGELSRYQDGKSVASASVEARFGWVLEGRAVQDVWITPARVDRQASAGAGFNWYGTTLRVFDPATSA